MRAAAHAGTPSVAAGMQLTSMGYFGDELAPCSTISAGCFQKHKPKCSANFLRRVAACKAAA
jgi:hypothetical protein